MTLPDPAGGSFNAAGDLDRLLGRSALVIWSTIDPYDDAVLRSPEMNALLNDIVALAPEAKPGPEQRGLDRLRVMPQACREDHRLRLRFAGD